MSTKILRLSPLHDLLPNTREGLVLMVQGHLALATRGVELDAHTLQGLVKLNSFALHYLKTGAVPTEVRKYKRKGPLDIKKVSSLEKPSKDELNKVKVYLHRVKDREKGKVLLIQKLLEQAEEVLTL